MEAFAKEFIEKKRREAESLKEAQKHAFFDEQGMTEVEYTDERESAAKFTEEEKEQYPFMEGNFNVFRRYRKIYPEVSQEDYLAMKEAQREVDELRAAAGEKPEIQAKKGRVSRLALALKVIAVLIFAGAFFAGIAMAGSEKIVTGRSYYPHVEKTFEIGTALIWWASGLVSGTLLLGFAQIVEHTERQTALLERIAAKR